VRNDLTETLKRLHKYQRRFWALPTPESICPTASSRTRNTFIELKILWSRYNVQLADDCLPAVPVDPTRKGKRLSDTEHQEVAELARAGIMTQTEIGKRYGITSGRVAQIKAEG